ncbi:hypothetical protein GYN67_08810 [Lactococcus piscium]|uniref:GDSL-type esterase/lipase family protein n=1 Tax=Pseudolactococcus carnosus TaxID=2749961 RepID=UPI001FB96678|nr:GDSL-type esterase/lipase family protein [Lactococcus carnosus]MCJ1996790.1 hypothetical protein [Lactococcus carnosus]
MTLMTNQDPQFSKVRENWVTTWSQAQKGIGFFPVNDNNHTVAYEILIQNTGDRVALTLGNYYSEVSLSIASLTVSLDKESGFKPVTVNGSEAFVVDDRGLVKTDSIALLVTSGTAIYVRIYYPDQPQVNRAISGNTFATHAERSIKGDFTKVDSMQQDDCYIDVITDDAYAMSFADGYESQKKRFTLTLQGVDVHTKVAGGTIVAFGDSITEQGHWVRPTQEKVSEKLGAGYSLVNAGISGNRLLRGFADLPRRTQFFGLAGIERFAHDVFEVNCHVISVVIALGVNDLHQPGTEAQFSIDELPTFNELVSGYQRLIKVAREHGSRVFLATLSPFIGYTVAAKNEEKEAIRKQINEWIRHNREVAGIYDFDALLSDPTDCTKANPLYDSGDKLHPSPEGGLAMSRLINVTAFNA